jgi:hypothetical protein
MQAMENLAAPTSINGLAVLTAKLGSGSIVQVYDLDVAVDHKRGHGNRVEYRPVKLIVRRRLQAGVSNLVSGCKKKYGAT